jgi:type II secretory pathway pseudopilin PulG
MAMPAPQASSPQRRGFILLEVIAALAVLTVAMASITPLFVRHTRLVAESRRERIALEELANQAERLAVVKSIDLDRHLAALALSPIAAGCLPEPRLTATRGSSPLGEQITLRLAWNSPGRDEKPLTLVTWVAPAEQGRGDAQ